MPPRIVVLILLLLLPSARIAAAESSAASAHSIAVFNLAEEAKDYRKAIELHEAQFEKYKPELTKTRNTRSPLASPTRSSATTRAHSNSTNCRCSSTRTSTRAPILLEHIGEAQLHLGSLEEAEANYKEALALRVKTVGDPNEFNAVRIRAGLTGFNCGAGTERGAQRAPGGGQPIREVRVAEH